MPDNPRRSRCVQAKSELGLLHAALYSETAQEARFILIGPGNSDSTPQRKVLLHRPREMRLRWACSKHSCSEQLPRFSKPSLASTRGLQLEGEVAPGRIRSILWQIDKSLSFPLEVLHRLHLIQSQSRGKFGGWRY